MSLALQTPKKIMQKLRTIYQKGEHLQAHLNNGTFSVLIKFKRLSQKNIQDNFTEIRAWIEELNRSPFKIEFQQIGYRSLGEQSIPKVLHLNQEQFLKYLSKERAFERHIYLCQMSFDKFPKLETLLRENPSLVMEYDEIWEKLLAVCDYFVAHPKPNCYIRELEIEGVDTKFIEQYKKIVDKLLSTILESDFFDNTVTKLSHHGFERRYGLRYDLPTIRFRILDKSLYIHGLSDISLPLDEFKKLDLASKTVYITENKINGLSFPNIKGAMVIFGLGYGVESLKDVAWLREKKLFYWGDIDTHGFAMLSQIRSYFLHIKSLGMDEKVIYSCKQLAVEESDSKRFLGELKSLTSEEQSVFERLKDDFYQKRFRLEQERIPLSIINL
ncbi:hypothetical protein GSY74_03980 [Sulfurovum sp. bin170]|uniref:Wadjet anti-phage system protein JetD domain-containing protein n=1 Tax=Sulfurovum sp. bin170 TaxID=2695268 RepID=UPI0013DF41FD|nr:Wadjet anti-phage system protein JetD domain-containing protein [Sulfurovum sp. bin170]NEW60432.1 hypothetical protein [Sulfurovum sp. bin170]